MRALAAFVLFGTLLVVAVALGAKHYDDRCCTEVFDRCQGCVVTGLHFTNVGYNEVWGCVYDDYVALDCTELSEGDEGAEPCWESEPDEEFEIYSDSGCTIVLGHAINGKVWADECYDGPTCD